MALPVTQLLDDRRAVRRGDVGRFAGVPIHDEHVADADLLEAVDDVRYRGAASVCVGTSVHTSSYFSASSSLIGLA